MAAKNKIEIQSFQGLRARTVQSYTEANVKAGVQYYFTVNWPTADPIGNGPSNARNVVFSTGDVPVVVKTRIVSYIGEEFTIELFANPTVSGGAVVPVANYNQRNAVPTTVNVLKDAVVSNDGIPFSGEPDYYYGGLQSNRRDASAIPDGRERVLQSNTTYLVKITSTEGSGRFSYFLDWYEGETDLPRPQNDN